MDKRLLPWCQQRSSLLSTSCYITIQPMIVALLSWLFLGEDLSWTLLLGGVFIIVGLGLVAFSRYREEHTLHFDSPKASSPTILNPPQSSPTSSLKSLPSSLVSGRADEIVDVKFDDLEPELIKLKASNFSSLETVSDLSS